MYIVSSLNSRMINLNKVDHIEKTDSTQGNYIIFYMGRHEIRVKYETKKEQEDAFKVLTTILSPKEL